MLTALLTMGVAVAGATYNQDVAPLLRRHCVECHRPGGGAPFSLTSFTEVRQRSRQIVEVTRRRYMPPWLPQPGGSAEFDYERRMTSDEIALIERWVLDGSAEGDRDTGPAPAATGDWQLGAPDLVVSTDVFTLQADGADVFRTFVAPVSLASMRYVQAFEFRAAITTAIHHANIKIDLTNSSRLLDSADPAPGYEGAGGRSAAFPDGHFLGWTPGQGARRMPQNLTFALRPGSDMVFELHMMPTGKPESLRAQVGLYFSDQPPAALPAMLRLGRQDIDIPADDRSYVSEDAYVLPIAAKVLAVQPHAHRLARSMRGWATLPDGSSRPLLAIDEWDMAWQDTYVLRRPLELPAGSRLSMRFVYDNSPRNPRAPRPGRRVTFGQTTGSEMGDLWLQLLPLDAAERPHLVADVAAKMLQADIVGVEKMIAVAPRDSRLRTDLAFCYLEAKRMDDALEQLRRAVELAPESAFHHHDLAVVLIRQKRFDEAERHLRAAIGLKPDFADAYSNLGVIGYARHDLTAAIQWFERTLAIQPRDPVAHHNLGSIFAERRDLTSARAHFEQAVSARPDDKDSLMALAAVFQATGRSADAVAYYRRALAIDADAQPALVELAWILATARDSAVRDPAQAVHFAKRARDLSASPSAELFDALGAAYAADGQVERAIEAATQAVTRAGSPAMRAEMQQRLDAYRRLQERLRR